MSVCGLGIVRLIGAAFVWNGITSTFDDLPRSELVCQRSETMADRFGKKTFKRFFIQGGLMLQKVQLLSVQQDT